MLNSLLDWFFFPWRIREIANTLRDTTASQASNAASILHRIENVERTQAQTAEQVRHATSQLDGVQHWLDVVVGQSKLLNTLTEQQRLDLERSAHVMRQLDGVMHWVSVGLREIGAVKELELSGRDQRGDLVLALIARQLPPLGWSFHAERRLAADSIDHIVPKGTINDNTRHPRFVNACAGLFASPIRHMDLGCAGGGLVWDFTLAGHRSVGVEGSDRSQRDGRAEWRIIPDRLFTADIRYPLSFTDGGGEDVVFDLVTAWEVLEHIPEDGIAGLLSNIRNNLRIGGLLIVSIATSKDRDDATGQDWHATVQPREWWLERLAAFGLIECAHSFEVADFVRGSGNPRALDWDVRESPEMGFHLVLQKV